MCVHNSCMLLGDPTNVQLCTAYGHAEVLAAVRLPSGPSACTWVQGGQLEIVAASVVHLQRVAVDRATPRQAWDSAATLRHFSVVQQLEGQPWPAGMLALVLDGARLCSRAVGVTVCLLPGCRLMPAWRLTSIRASNPANSRRAAAL